MKSLFFLGVLCAFAGWGQTPAAPPPDPKAVIAIFDDGYKMTAGEFEALIPVLPDQYRTLAQQDPKKFLTVYAKFRKLAAEAERQKLGDKSPYKQGVDFAVTLALAQADYLEAQAAITIAPEELAKYYQGHKEPFRRLKVSGIKVAFGAPADTNSSPVNASRVPKKALTEEEAKAKAEKLVDEVRAGADFAKLVQSESDDETTKAKGGDFGVWKMSDNLPNDLRAAVMGLQQGEVSKPIRQPGGYYIMHVDAVTYTPLDEVKDVIFDQLKQEKARQWLDDLDKNTKVEFPRDQPGPSANPSDPKK